jgi:hypothetical protein
MEKGHQTNLAEAVKSGMWPTPRTTGLDGGSNSRKAAKARGMWPTPTTPAGGGERSGDRAGTGSLNYMARSGQLTGPKTTGALNPMWVAWLMGYPTEYLSCVHWETQSSRRSRKK